MGAAREAAADVVRVMIGIVVIKRAVVVGEQLQVRGGRGNIAVWTRRTDSGVFVAGIVVGGKVAELPALGICLLQYFTVVTAANIGFFQRLFDMERMFGFHPM